MVVPLLLAASTCAVSNYYKYLCKWNKWMNKCQPQDIYQTKLIANHLRCLCILFTCAAHISVVHLSNMEWIASCRFVLSWVCLELMWIIALVVCSSGKFSQNQEVPQVVADDVHTLIECLYIKAIMMSSTGTIEQQQRRYTRRTFYWCTSAQADVPLKIVVSSAFN